MENLTLNEILEIMTAGATIVLIVILLYGTWAIGKAGRDND